jgi:hypothetical protein
MDKSIFVNWFILLDFRLARVYLPAAHLADLAMEAVAPSPMLRMAPFQ